MAKYNHKLAQQDFTNQKHRVQPSNTGLLWAEVYAKSEDAAIKIIEKNKEFDYLTEYTEDLIVYPVSKTLKQLIDDFCNLMPLDELPDQAYKDKFEIEVQRLFYHKDKS